MSSCQFIYATHFIKGIVLLYMSGMLLYVQYISRHRRRSSATCLRSSFVVHGPSLSFPSTHTHFFIPPSPRDPSLDVSLYLLILSMPAWKYLFFFSKTYDHDITLFLKCTGWTDKYFSRSDSEVIWSDGSLRDRADTCDQLCIMRTYA